MDKHTPRQVLSDPLVRELGGTDVLNDPLVRKLGGTDLMWYVRKPRTGEHGCSSPERALADMRSMAGR
jgi:hypothetical protein